MTKKEARRLARMNAAALIEAEGLTELYGKHIHDPNDRASEELLAEAQRWIVKLIRGRNKG